jgi:choline dehydrogenase-like flavoprotein
MMDVFFVLERIMLARTSKNNPRGMRMIVDSRTIAPGTVLRADLCIVGAGAAGIAIAREFVNHASRVVVLESGGRWVGPETQCLCTGNIIGHQYPPLHICRRRVLGGSTSHWGGWARPLDDIDFEERGWVAYSGWPFTKERLKAEYARALTIWKLGECGYDREQQKVGNSEPFLTPTPNGFEDISFQINGTRFGKAYREELQNAQNLTLFLHASALEVDMDRANRTALSIRVASLEGNRFVVSSRNFVIAAGGIENARLLLVSRGSRTSGIGNDNDLVGRFFADHLHAHLPSVPLNGRQVPKFYHLRNTGKGALRGGISLTEDMRRRDKLLGFAVTIHNPDNPHDVVYPDYSNSGYDSLQALAKPFVEGELPHLIGSHVRTVLRHPVNAGALLFRKLVRPRWRAFMIGCRAEQAPNPNSRVMLDHERDAFGMNKVRLDWRLTEQDLHSIRRAQQLLDDSWNFANKDPRLKQTAGEHFIDVSGASHHMGTTRMHRDPKLGVVDEMCRVHGVRNLYIAGSSVFPTSGWAPPTLTIIALALRLADSLKQSQP